MEAIAFNEESHAAVLRLSTWERWRRGLKALREVTRDSNRTDLVLHAYEHINAGSEDGRTARFYASEHGERLYAEDRTLDSTTLDYDALLRLPEGSLGHKYARFMRDRGLTPDIFAAGGRLSRRGYAVKRMRQTHDLWHVLTGAATDVPGELELQAFTFAQVGIPSALLLVLAGVLRWTYRYPTLPLRVARGFLRGRQTEPLASLPWEDYWATPLAELREKLGCIPFPGAVV